jgi:hypothetical protein
MSTLSDIRTKVRRAIRDTGSDVFTDAELGDLINQALDTLSDVRPREVTESVTITANTYTYAPSNTYLNLFRIDIHNSSDSYRRQAVRSTGHRASGWDYFGGTLYLDVSYAPTSGDKYQLFGYARYIELTSDSTTTDAPAEVINAILTYSQMEAYGRLTQDRAAFQQWQGSPGNTDVSENELEQLRRGSVARWNAETRRLRVMRRTG